MQRMIGQICVGLGAGAVLSIAVGYVWLIWGANPDVDPLVSW